MAESTGIMRSRSAIVDLSTGTVQYEHTPPGIVRNYLGGRGINAAYLYRMLKPGIDLIILTGKSDKPVYLRVEDGVVTIRDAGKYWGLDIDQTQTALKRDIG